MYEIVVHRAAGKEFNNHNLPFELEIDLAVTKDNQLIVFHDEYLKLGFLKKSKISELSMKECEKNGIDSFENFLEKNQGFKLNLELKHHTDFRKILKKIEKSFPEVIANHKFPSFDMQALKCVKEINPNAYCNFIATCIDPFCWNPLANEKNINNCIDNNFNEISGHWLLFRPRMIKKAQEQGLVVGLGFVNNERVLNYCKKNNVTRLYTDNIEELGKIINLNYEKLKN